MKNNLRTFKSCDIDAWLPTRNDFLEVLIRQKMENGEFADVLNEIRDILENDYYHEEEEEEEEEEEDDDDEYEEEDDETEMRENESFYYDILKTEAPLEIPLDSNSNNLLYAGYADCMEEAIRFLVEEENISPDHPVVKNLKAHLEKSKDRILQPLSFQQGNEEEMEQYALCNIFLETFQNCRDSG